MTDLILIAVLLAQITQIVILLRRIDYSKEDAILKDATKKAQDELNKFPPQTN